MRGASDPTEIDLAKRLHSSKSNRKTTTKIRPWMKAILYTTTILSLIVPTITNKDPIKINHFNSQPGIFFDEIGRANLLKSEWNLIIYYDLTNYWLEMAHLQEAGNLLHLKCQNNATLLNNRDSCLVISKQVSHLLSEVEDRNQILQQTRINRKRRGVPLEIIGNIANGLFGILDQKSAETYDKQISALQNNQAHVSDF